jgi:hypothetical protein
MYFLLQGILRRSTSCSFRPIGIAVARMRVLAARAIARDRGIAPVHLDLFYWRDEG